MQSSSALLSSPGRVVSQTHTAPIIEFRCMFTPDLRRKQKRWQDGKLKFHTHNRRIMVYDEKANYIGDSHWQEEYALAEGEELQLERGGVLVEVQECIGKTEQDLSELVDKRLKEKEERAAAKAGKGTPLRAQSTTGLNDRGVALYPPSKPLHALLTPSGHYGRAVLPLTSPFEERQGALAERDSNDNGRAAKRQKINDNPSSRGGYAQNLLGATLNLSSSRPQSTAPIRYERLNPTITAKPRPIDLTLSDDEGQIVTKTNKKERLNKGSDQKTSWGSPPVKSGYASSLTGARLDLSAQRSRNEASVSKPQVQKVSTVVETDSSSAEEAPKQDVRSIVKSSKRPHSVSKSRDYTSGNVDDRRSKRSKANSVSQKTSLESEAVKKSRPRHDVSARYSEQALSLSSESENDTARKPIISKSNASRSSKQPLNLRQRSPSPLHHPEIGSTVKTSESNKCGSSPNQLVSSLRIKSRPRGKMMMLMDRPLVRTASGLSRTASELSNGSRERSMRDAALEEDKRGEKQHKARAKKREDRIPMSQATARLHEFVANQDARLRARLQKQKARELDAQPNDSNEEENHSGMTEEEEDDDDGIIERRPRQRDKKATEWSWQKDANFGSSSPRTDKGIDHFEIDAILTRRSSLASASESEDKRLFTHSNKAPKDARAFLSSSHSSRSAVPRININKSQGPSPQRRQQNARDTADGSSSPVKSPLRRQKSQTPTREEIEISSDSDEADSMSTVEVELNQDVDTRSHALSPEEKAMSSSDIDDSQPIRVKAPRRGSVDDTDVSIKMRPSGRVTSRGPAASSPLLQSSSQASDNDISDTEVIPTTPPRHKPNVRHLDPPIPVPANPPRAQSPSPSPSPANTTPNLISNAPSHANPATQPSPQPQPRVTSPTPSSSQNPIPSSNSNSDSDSLALATSMPNFHLPFTKGGHVEEGSPSGRQQQQLGMQSATAHFVAMLSGVDEDDVGDCDQGGDGEGVIVNQSTEEELEGTLEDVNAERVGMDVDSIEEGKEHGHGEGHAGGEEEDVGKGDGDGQTQAQVPGPSTLEMAEEVSSTVDMADIPSWTTATRIAAVPTTSATTTTTTTTQPRRPNPATTKGLSLSALAASTVNAPPIDAALGMTATGNNTNINANTPANNVLLPPPPQKVAAASHLPNLNHSLHSRIQNARVLGATGPSRSLSGNLEDSTRAVLAKRIYPPPPVRPDKHMLHDHQATRYQEQGSVAAQGGATLLWLGEPAAAGGGAVVPKGAEASGDGRQCGTSKREDGRGVASGPWSREAFDLFGEWVRPVL